MRGTTTQEIAGSGDSGELLAQHEWATAPGHRRNPFDSDDPLPQVAKEVPRVDGPSERSAADVSVRIVPPQASADPIALFESVQEWIDRLIDLDLQELLDTFATKLDRGTYLKSDSLAPGLTGSILDAMGTLAANYPDTLASLGNERLPSVNIHDRTERLVREWNPNTGQFDGASNDFVAAGVGNILSRLIDRGLQGLLGMRISQVDLDLDAEPDGATLSSGTSVYGEQNQLTFGSTTESFGSGIGSLNTPVLDGVGDPIFTLSDGVNAETAAETTADATVGPVTVTGGSTINATAGDDTLNGTAGDDTINGLAGNDTLTGAGGADTLDGGTGTDTAAYRDSDTGVTVNLATGTGNGGDAEGDTLVRIEDVDASDFDDTLVGDANDNRLRGRAGDDTLDGGAGADDLDGGDGNDTLVWDAADTMIDGDNGTDTLRVDSGNVDLTSFAGTIEGFEQIDMEADAGANTLTLAASDVLDLSDTGILTVLGDAGDSVGAGTGWTDGGTAGGFHTYTQGSATLILDTDLTVNPDILP